MRVLPSLLFDNMFKWLCHKLPSEIPLSEENMQFFILIEDIDAKHFNDEETSLISDLCMAFYTATHNAKHILTHLIPAHVRMDKVKEDFERRMRDVQADPSRVKATPHDLELIDEYFRLNT